MKPFIITILFLSLLSCTKNSQLEENLNSNPEIEINSAELTFQPEMDQNSTDAIAISMSSISGSNGKGRIYLNNRSGSNIDLSTLESEILSLRSDISILRNRCPSVLRNRRLCYVDFQVDYIEGVSVDQTLVLLPIGGSETSDPNFAIVISVDERYATELSGAGADIVKSEAVLNFGTITSGGVAKKRLFFINNNRTIDLPVPSLPTLPAGLSQVGTNCDANISKRSFCYIDLEYSYQGQVGASNSINETINLTSDNMSLVEKELQIVANNVPELDPSQAYVSISELNLPEASQVKAGQRYTKRIYVSNIVDQNIDFDANEFISGANILKNSCLNKSLKPGSYCYIDLYIDGTNDGEALPPVSINSPPANIDQNIFGEISLPTLFAGAYDPVGDQNRYIEISPGNFTDQTVEIDGFTVYPAINPVSVAGIEFLGLYNYGSSFLLDNAPGCAIGIIYRTNLGVSQSGAGLFIDEQGSNYQGGNCQAISDSLLSPGSTSNILGCTDPLADNQVVGALIDDGSCTYPAVLGCTDDSATNYNSLATVDDSSCDYNPANYELRIVSRISIPSLKDTILPTVLSATELSAPINGRDDSRLELNELRINPWDFSNYIFTDFIAIFHTETAAGASSCRISLNRLSNGNPQKLEFELSRRTPSIKYGLSQAACASIAEGLNLEYTTEGTYFGNTATWYYGSAPVNGCTDDTATNYNNLANVDDGSCTFPPSFDLSQYEFLIGGTVEDGSIDNYYPGDTVFSDNPSFGPDGSFIATINFIKLDGASCVADTSLGDMTVVYADGDGGNGGFGVGDIAECNEIISEWNNRLKP